jgi:hypothetical protein
MAKRSSKKYRTYLSEQLTKDSYNVYFKIDEKYPVNNYEWLRVYRGSTILSTVSDAYQKGQQLEVTIGSPYKELDKKPTATIKTAKIIWQPT